MNVRTLCLSILFEQDASGYEIRKLCTEGECSYFVEASFGSIYPALAKLEDDGLVTSRVEHQAGKPSKKLYSITDAGRATFIEALHEPIAADVYRSPFLLFARFAHLIPKSVVQSRVDAQIARLDADVAELKRLQEAIQAGDQAARDNRNDLWITRYGIICLEVARDQLNAHMNDLVATGRADEADAKAAE